ncbi:unnamed protein product [Dibothriocephalus latus]|uniref:Saposin B-type domain-containing protein n=1 Tax=Dibothriocephalus latus TaxID=60516 RepID=A0A3P7P186_DIBLA|nr:unnamed protein product [Dibothriocephalus latus]
MRFFMLTICLLATVALASAYQKKAAILGQKSFLATIPSSCMEYVEKLVKWEIIESSKKEIDWIFKWPNSTTCAQFVSDQLTEEDVDPCMQCLLPYEQHVIKLPGCQNCYDNFTQAKKLCKRCLTEIVYVTEAVTCAVEAKVKLILTLLHLGV